MKAQVGVLLAAACVLFPLVAAAQGLTGAFFGSVKDEQDAVLVGALVRVTSPALIGGPVTVTTNEKGHWRFPALSPGTYVMDVERPGFATYREDVVIGAGASLERTVILSLAGIAESLVVEGAGSRMEARGSGVETRFRFEDLRTIPTRRFSMFDFIREAPGMSGTSMSGGQDASANAAAAPGSVSSFGSGTNENLFLIDGTNFTCPCSGGAAAEPGVDFIQEIQVQSVGASVEHGNIQGAVINVITRQGGDRFLFDASYYGQPSWLTSQPVRLTVPRGSQPTSGYERLEYRDFTNNLGGPLVRNRLWFFSGYQYLRDSDSQPGTDPRFPRVYEQDKLFTKLTWRLSPSLQLMQSVHQEFWSNADRPTLVTPFEATAQHRASVPSITFGHLMHTLSDRTLWEARVGRFVSRRNDEPSTGRRRSREPSGSRDRPFEWRAGSDRRHRSVSYHSEGNAHALPVHVGRRSPVEGRDADGNRRTYTGAGDSDRRAIRRQCRSAVSGGVARACDQWRQVDHAFGVCQ